MYTVPAKVSVHAKTLISAFENGELNALNDQEDGAPVQATARPSVSQDELAQPGTARQLLLSYEARRTDTATSPPARGSRSSKLTADRFTGFELQSPEVEKKTMGVGDTTDMSGDRSGAAVEVSGGGGGVPTAAAVASDDVFNGDVTDAVAAVTAAVKQPRTVLLVSATRPDTDLDLVLRAVTVRAFTEAGDEVIVTDTYSVTRDVSGDSITADRNNLMKASLIILHYRPVLNALPGVLKLWLDQVFTSDNGQRVDTALLAEKKCAILLCSDNETDSWHVPGFQENVLRFIGLDILPVEVITTGPGQSSAEVITTGPGQSSVASSEFADTKDAAVSKWLSRLATF